jgi:hypothetical protein
LTECFAYVHGLGLRLWALKLRGEAMTNGHVGERRRVKERATGRGGHEASGAGRRDEQAKSERGRKMLEMQITRRRHN